ncbi:hypothetical protein [Stieleria sp. JC731]|uniref:hypothetical protein n=1 Tax=Pirellulaceae TaxID=2691357 RepID=UPI001E35585D|nr:hypothetical protein [Stieleria sp. JC731]
MQRLQGLGVLPRPLNLDLPYALSTLQKKQFSQFDSFAQPAHSQLTNGGPASSHHNAKTFQKSRPLARFYSRKHQFIRVKHHDGDMTPALFFLGIGRF